ncbi:hypothetical protein G7Y89_g13657 [Cudoniella acicularis]|uniref:Uncharacterized protein n=1 Tax=Cudoniella acicularis TaxID=354080 RepID=A0A8H4R6U5_9HELO|nr:hypothetical protein G7Y89_g13657 [Cudoniella acicularis]
MESDVVAMLVVAEDLCLDNFGQSDGIPKTDLAGQNPSSDHSPAKNTMEPESEMPGLWSEQNLPSPSAMLKIIQAVCACPVVASNKALSNSTPNGVASKEDYQHSPTNDTIVSKENSLMSNGSGYCNNKSSTDYTLSILPIYPQPLNPAPSSQESYHHSSNSRASTTLLQPLPSAPSLSIGSSIVKSRHIGL